MIVLVIKNNNLQLETSITVEKAKLDCLYMQLTNLSNAT